MNGAFDDGNLVCSMKHDLSGISFQCTALVSHLFTSDFRGKGGDLNGTTLFALLKVPTRIINFKYNTVFPCAELKHGGY